MNSQGVKKTIFFAMAAGLLVAFFVGAKTQAATDLIIDYFAKIYLPHKTTGTGYDFTGNNNDFGIISWLPGQEFELLLKQNKNNKNLANIPIDNTPEYLIDNLYKRIAIAQQPTAHELEQEILATVVKHNLPIAVLNVWRPKTVIVIKNLSNQTWQQSEVVLTSSDFDGNLSFFRDPSWESSRTITTMKELSVAPGETATFEFLIDGRGRPQVYDHVYRLLINKQPIHLDAKGALYWLTRVDPYL